MKVAEVAHGARVICPGRGYRRPAVSIVTPTYCRNAEGLLAKCLDSAMAQTFEDFELIVIDDGSSDGSELTIREAALRDDRIVYIRHDRNSGLPAIRTNEGVMRARADAIAFLFDDNIFQSDFIQSAWAALEASGADVVHSNVHMLAKNGKDFTLGGWPLTLELLRNLNTIPNGGVMVRRSFFDRYGLYDPHILMRRVCDWDLWLRALALGATFRHLDQDGAVEHGLVSNNSLGNTVAWDVKIAYGYMLDEERFAERARRLGPVAIGDYDVLDPTPIVPYVRNRAEWSQLIEAVYEPFLTRHGLRDFDPSLPSNRAASLNPEAGWNAESALIANRRRYLIVSNSINPWAAAWIHALRRRQPGAIVVNCPEWQLSAFQPHDVDLVILMDCTSGFLKPQIDAFCAASVPVVYVLGYGEQCSTTVPVAFTSRYFEKNPHIAALLGPTMYFPQPGACFGSARREGAKALLAFTYATVLAKPDAARLKISDFITFPFESVANARDVMEGEPLRNIAYGSGDHSSGGADEVVASPSSVASVVDGASVRPSWEGLGAVAETRPRSVIRVGADILDAAPLAERVGLSSVMTDRQVALHVTDRPESQEASLDRPTADAWQGWIANLALSTQLAGQIARARAVVPARPNVAIFLNSEMFSGSEIYGLMIARGLTQVGYRVQVFVPDESVYGNDSDASPLNKWLLWYGLSEAKTAPYRPGSGYFSAVEVERSLMVARLAAFLSANTFDMLICAGFMPVFAAVPDLPALLFVALFQPSAYQQGELAFLRGRISGFMSDSSWSFDVHRRLLGGPGAIVRAMLPIDAGPPARPKTPHLAGKVRVAIGGTLQPRKRQLEAIEAVRILRDRGLSVELNIYGYALDMMDHYISEIQQSISSHDLSGLVRRHGLVSMQKIADDNDVVLMASVDESLPQTLVELMRLGLVGAAGLSGGIDEVIKDHVTGYLTQDMSPRGLADVLLRAINDRNRWPAIAQNARKHLDAEYDLASNTEALLDLLIEGAQIESSPFGRLKPH